MLAEQSDQVFTGCRRPSRTRPILPILSWAGGLLAALGIGNAALAVTPVGAEFQVNTYTTSWQMRPSVAADPDGDHVVVWRSYGSVGNDDFGYSIQGQQYDASGNAVGSQFQVNTYTTLEQYWPSVAADADGNFVVVWMSQGSSGSDTSSWSIQGQRYDASGNTVGSQFQVNTYTTNSQFLSSVAANADGSFVVVWQSDGSAGSDDDSFSIQARRYDASGNALGSEFQVNTYTTSFQEIPSVAVDADGGFVVAWESYGGDYPSYPYAHSDVRAQRYDASGDALGSEFQVNTYTTSDQNGPSVGVDSDGDFVVVWSSYRSPGTDNAWSVWGQRFDASGNAIGSEFQVNTYTTSSQFGPSVATNADGSFMVVWESYGSAGSDDDSFSIQARRYDASGDAVGSEFQVNTYTSSYQRAASVAADSDGDLVIVWYSDGSAGTDTDAWSIQGQRYTFQAPQVPSLTRPGMIGLALLLFGIAAAGLRARLRKRA